MDTQRILVIILQCETKPADNNIKNLSLAFADPYFDVQVCNVESSPNITNLENYYIRKALTFAAEGPYTVNADMSIVSHSKWSNLPCLIIKDSSVSHVNDPKIMVERIRTAVNTAKDADLFFLCKWNDACEKYSDVESAPNLKWSLQPTATQAILFRKNARDIIRKELEVATISVADVINSHIAKKKLKATVFVPNIIDFDIDLATANTDYYKMNECAVQTASSSSTNTTSAIVWFFVLFFIILLVAWTMIQTT